MILAGPLMQCQCHRIKERRGHTGRLSPSGKKLWTNFLKKWDILFPTLNHLNTFSPLYNSSICHIFGRISHPCKTSFKWVLVNGHGSVCVSTYKGACKRKKGVESHISTTIQVGDRGTIFKYRAGDKNPAIFPLEHLQP